MISPVESQTSSASTKLCSTGLISTDLTRPSTVALPGPLMSPIGLTFGEGAGRSYTSSSGSAAAARADLPSRPGAATAPGLAGRDPSAAVPAAAVLTAAVPACRSSSTRTRLCTSNGTMVAAASGMLLTTAAILSAVRSCSSRPRSGEKLRRGRITVTCVPGTWACSQISSSVARSSLRSGQLIRSSGTSSTRLIHLSRSLSARAVSMTKWTARSEVGRRLFA
jgi:hypothetical protein